MEAVGTSNANTLTSFNYPQYPKHRVNARELYINLHLLLISALFCAVSQHFFALYEPSGSNCDGFVAGVAAMFNQKNLDGAGRNS